MSRKDKRCEEARLHIIDMQQRYLHEIENSISHTQLYQYRPSKSANIVVPSPSHSSTKIDVEALDSVSAVFAHASEGRVALLDFASYRNPGGGYENGAWAQEEAVCSESDLFNILDTMRSRFYEPNRKELNRSLYTDKTLYVPDVVFERDGKAVMADVIVCAAPNVGAAQEHGVLLRECEQARHDRVSMVMNVAADNEVDCLILGAFGCGVFRNDPHDVADDFKQWLDAHPNQFEHVVFAIPSGGANFSAFEETFACSRSANNSDQD